MHLADIGVPSLIAFAVCFFLLRWLLRGRLAATVMDQPNHRSLHTTPTPRIGGLGVLAGVLGGGMLVEGIPPLLFILLALLGGFCFIDDRLGLSAALRLAVHLFAAAVWIVSLGKVGGGDTAHWLMIIGVMLALGWMMNLYNFMDGANGLAGGMTLFGFGAYGAAAALAGQPGLAALGFVIAAAALAFLLFNFDPARVFLGDVGSIPLGFLAGALGLWGWQTNAWPLWFPLLVFSPFIVDATYTLLRRLLRGEKVWQAHRQHAYQRLVCSGWSHRRLAVTAYGLMAACAVSALVLRTMPIIAVAAGGLTWWVIYAVLLWVVARRWQHQ